LGVGWLPLVLLFPRSLLLLRGLRLLALNGDTCDRFTGVGIGERSWLSAPTSRVRPANPPCLGDGDAGKGRDATPMLAALCEQRFRRLGEVATLSSGIREGTDCLLALVTGVLATLLAGEDSTLDISEEDG